AGGFGALLLGHCEPRVSFVVAQQSKRLLQALGDVYPSDRKLELGARLARLYSGDARVIVGQSGSDAVSAALKTAQLFSGRSGVLAFAGAYHGLGYGPLAACGLRSSYRDPFAEQLNQHVRFVEYPSEATELASCLDGARRALSTERIGAVLVEPILGRGGVVVPPRGFLSGLSELCRESGALLVVDEIWTGLGRAGKLLFSAGEAHADLVCLGKGLGGGLPISAVIGRSDVMQAWQRPREVVHTSTFAGNPLAAATAVATLDILENDGLVARAEETGARFRDELAAMLTRKFPSIRVRGAGLMLGVDLGARPGAGSRLQEDLLARGYITSTGGVGREVLVLTPPLNIDEGLLAAFSVELLAALTELAP
ncbi:MAG TPA: aminotransferase class III-fold pyridoxal phosphate-dependent enzyme, partial [Polyangiaceae bacterium]|nr:aminotransferase class III-fold pyridoxal phosphate-dependent enzyme [Polyangiaceae bacterium]